jgi:signal peptidase I
LAFFFKAFAAEAFVIPTGSMATTLMGRHKDVHCEQCGFPFQISASEESNDAAEHPRATERVLAGTCPQCRYTMYVGSDNVDKKIFPSFNGDRIFVNKSLFDFRRPTRWHVTVFRYPGRPQVNYIKRLVGVENETVMLQHGDVFVKKDGETEFSIQRKPLHALLSMLRPVDDNDHVLADLQKIGWAPRWSDAENHWIPSDDYKSFQINRREQQAACWLNYRHIVPSSDDWYYLSQKELPPSGLTHNPQLITDFVGYNSGITDRYAPYMIAMRERKQDGAVQKEHFCQKRHGIGLNWVGDLAVGCRLHLEQQEKGTLLLRLVKGGVFFYCCFDLSTGQVTLSIPDVTEFRPATAQTTLHQTGTFDLLFCNIDEELRLMINGKEIDFRGENRYDFLCQPNRLLARDRSPTQLDTVPAGIGVEGAAVKVERLKIFRDMYYIASDGTMDSECDLIYPVYRNGYSLTEHTINQILSSPADWKHFGKTRSVEFPLGKGQFLMLGDNSAKSKDSRLWTSDGIPHYVERNFLIGEAIFVYWPHGLRIPGTNIALIPNVTDIRFIE